MLLRKRLYFAMFATFTVLLIYLESRKFPKKNKRIFMVKFFKKENFDRNVSRCQLLKIPEGMSEEIWQPVGYQTNIHVYSAFSMGSKIRIVGVKLLKQKLVVFCQVWNGGIESALSVVKADMIDVPEHHSNKYTSYMFDCAVEHSYVSFAVSLVPDPCVEPMNILKVIHDKPKFQTNFTICLQPFFFKNESWHFEYKIVEFIELSKILGAKKFVFYICNTTTEVDNVLMHYQREKIVDILPWKLPKIVFPNIHVKGQLAAENDCLYRYGNKSKYLVYVDVDEFIIPRQFLTWNDMMDHLQQGFAEYNFRNVVFRTNWPNTNINYSRRDVALKYNVQSFLKLSRDIYIFPHKIRSKCIINPRLVDIVGIHFVWKFKNTSFKQYKVNESKALVYHYRHWSGTMNEITHFVDKEIFKYCESFLNNVDRVWKLLNKKV